MTGTGPTGGSGPDPVLRLLALAAEGTPADAPGRGPTEVLDELLLRPLPLDPEAPESVPALVGEVAEGVWDAWGQSVRELLLSPGTAPLVLETIKTYAKHLASRPASRDAGGAGRSGPGALQAAATAVYYAAVASALVFHGQRLSRQPPEALADGFASLVEKPWIPGGLRDLLRKALAICRAGAADRGAQAAP